MLDESSLEATIRLAYEKLEIYSQAADRPLSFELSDFTTLSSDDYDTVYWTDVTTLMHGDILRMSRRHDGDLNVVEYAPSWHRSREELGPDQTLILSALTFQDSIDASDKELKLSQGLTSYDVKVTCQGRSRTYRAAFVWQGDSQGQVDHLWVRDYITEGVEMVMTENVKPSNSIGVSACPSDEGQGGTNGEPGTPVLIDLDGGGLTLTGLEDAVWFDIDADGELEWMGWTVAESGDAFLALDRNGNGLIDDGRELFGDTNAEYAGPASTLNGYSALAVFDIDAPGIGGNYDGVIDAQDEIFDSLLLWIDASHDGISQPEELHSLASRGISALDLEFHEAGRQDRHGNEMRLFSFVHFLDGTRSQSADIYFVTAPDEL